MRTSTSCRRAPTPPLGKRLQQHRAQAESYVLHGQRGGGDRAAAARAAQSGDGDFYQLSSVEARLRELRAIEIEAKPK